MDPLLQKQLAIYFTLMSTYHAVEALPYGHVDASALLKRGVVAEPLAAEAADGKTRHREERFFEPMREKEWRDKGHRLADVGPVNRDPDDDEFLAALSVANALQRALTWEATDDGMSVLCGSNYMRIGYVFSYRYLRCSRHRLPHLIFSLDLLLPSIGVHVHAPRPLALLFGEFCPSLQMGGFRQAEDRTCTSSAIFR